MDYIIFLKEPVFWLLATIGSIFLSVVGNLVTPKVQQLLSRFSQVRKSRIKEKNEEVLMAVAMMQKSDTFRTSWKIDAVLEALHGIGIMLLSLAVASIVPIMPFWRTGHFVYPLIAIFSVFGFKKILSGIKKSNLSKLADERTKVLIETFRNEMDFLHKNENKGKECPYSQDKAMKEWDEQHFGFSIDKISNRSILEKFIAYL